MQVPYSPAYSAMYNSDNASLRPAQRPLSFFFSSKLRTPLPQPSHPLRARCEQIRRLPPYPCVSSGPHDLQRSLAGTPTAPITARNTTLFRTTRRMGNSHAPKAGLASSTMCDEVGWTSSESAGLRRGQFGAEQSPASYRGENGVLKPEESHNSGERGV